MNVHILYEKIDEELYEIYTHLDQIQDLSLVELINLINMNLNKDAKCLIYIEEADSWVLCKNDSTLIFMIRSFLNDELTDDIEIMFKENKLSPNQSLCSESKNSVSTKGSIINEYNETKTILNDIEPFTYEDIIDIERNRLIAIPSEKLQNSFFMIDSLSIISFVKNELYSGKNFFDIELEISDKNGGSEIIKFNKSLWTKYLARNNNNSEELLEFFGQTFYNVSNHENELRRLNLNQDLLFRLKVFIDDMIKFNNDTLCYLSLNNPNYYFTSYHFSESEIEYLLNFPTSSGLTYRELFDIFMRNKKSEICTSHDIAPFIYKTFGISKNFNKDASFNKNAKKFKGINSKQKRR